MAAGAEPDEIVLEDSQIRRALSTKDFFLVIVSGVEGAAATPRVRVIVNPVGQLRMSERSQVRFGGIRQSLSLVYDLRPGARTPGPTTARRPAADRRPPARGQRGSSCACGFGGAGLTRARPQPTRLQGRRPQDRLSPVTVRAGEQRRTVTVPKPAGNKCPVITFRVAADECVSGRRAATAVLR